MSDAFRVYGVTIESAYPLGRFLPGVERAEGADLTFEVVAQPPPPVDAPIVYDEHSIRISRGGSTTRIAFGDSTVHVVEGDRIVCHLLQPAHEFLVPIQLLGMVMAVWLEAHARVVLHASVVGVGDGAALFLAGPKAGKTSLAAAFTAGGDPMVSEDLAPITVDDVPLVHPGYPLMRMWPETVRHFTGRSEGFEEYHPAFAKVWVPVDALGRFADEPLALGCVYLPERHDRGPVEIEVLDSMSALRALMTGSFLADMIEPAVDAGERLERLGRLIDTVPLKRLRYPAGLAHLDAVRAAVHADLPQPTLRPDDRIGGRSVDRTV
jgi:hypothetical protein